MVGEGEKRRVISRVMKVLLKIVWCYPGAGINLIDYHWGPTVSN